jgi:hypothetical protein
VARGVTSTATEPPFVVVPGAGQLHQTVQVVLTASSGTGRETGSARSEATFVARNSAADGSTTGPTCTAP